MTADERFEIINQLYLKFDRRSVLSHNERIYYLCFEALGGLCNGALPLWTGYDEDETHAFIRAIDVIGFTSLASRLNQIEGWIRGVPGFGDGDPRLTSEQESEIDVIVMRFKELAPDSEKVLYEFAVEHELLEKKLAEQGEDTNPPPLRS
jgi:hypothetical protein